MILANQDSVKFVLHEHTTREATRWLSNVTSGGARNVKNTSTCWSLLLFIVSCTRSNSPICCIYDCCFSCLCQVLRFCVDPKSSPLWHTWKCWSDSSNSWVYYCMNTYSKTKTTQNGFSNSQMRLIDRQTCFHRMTWRDFWDTQWMRFCWWDDSTNTGTSWRIIWTRRRRKVNNFRNVQFLCGTFKSWAVIMEVS